ncbi:MAG: DUF2510 domain-containing protein [Actinomycetota bacterium]|nr:DUF2510 domain-containing protein [Actinomycetota bacterium]
MRRLPPARDRIVNAQEFSMYPAGWFTDPQDLTMLRYYDGQAWTEHQRPGAAPTAPAQPAPSLWPPEQTAPLPSVEPAQPGHAAWGLPEQVAQPVQPVVPTWPPTPAAGAWQQPGGGGHPPHYRLPARNSRRRPLIIGLVAILVAGLLAGGYFAFLKDDAPKITYQGAKIKDASGVLTSAEHSLDGIVDKRHGAKADDTRCYYAIPKAQPAGAKKTDIDTNLRCGPVLFVDGDPAGQYLKFPVTRSGGAKPVSLTAATTPLTDVPVSADDVTLQRPDGKKAPSGAGGLKVPAPPAAAADAIVAADIGSEPVPAAPKGAVMGSWSGGVHVTNLGPVIRYGKGDDARSAPPGQKLIAFAGTGAEGNDLRSTDLTSSAIVVVDGASPLAVPAAASGQYVVVAVPTGAKVVDLVLRDNGLNQTLSLLDGKPGSGNVTVLARQNRETAKAATAKVVFTFSPGVVFADNSTGTTENATVTLRLADLSYRNTDQAKPVTATRPDAAIMHVSVNYVSAHDKGTFGFPAGLLTFTPAGGKPVHARNISTTAGRIYNVFEVPGNVTTGTLTISGAVHETFQGSPGSYLFGIRAPVKIPIAIPAG